MASQEIEDHGYPIQIYKFKDGKRELDTAAINRVLNEVHEIPVAIVSVNGNKRTGKSFLLNFFLLFLINGNHPDWFSEGKENLDGFAWKGGSKRQTVGMWIWSKPFILNTENGRVAVILMDTQGSFDQQTTFKECTLMFCISVWLSSIFIYNIQGQLDEDKLQFLEYFTDFATRFSQEDIQYPGKLFQDFIFLMRDWPWPKDHTYGLHNHNSPKTKNFMKELIVGGEDFSEEAMATRQQILDYFNYVSCFLLPHPGLSITENIDGCISEMDPKFANYMKEFVHLVLEKEKIKPKMLYGDIMTGKKLKDVVDKWANLIRNQEFPEPKTLSEATAEAHLEMALRRAEKRYDARILDLAKGGMEDSLFESKHLEITCEVINQFKEAASKFPKYEERYGYSKKLEKRINKCFSIYCQINQATRRETEYKEHLEESKSERKIIKRKLERQQTQIEHQQQEMLQQKGITEEEKRRKEKEIEEMKNKLELLKQKIKDQRKKIKQEEKQKNLASKQRFQIFKPIASALGNLLDAVCNGFITIVNPSTYTESSPQVNRGDVVENDSDKDSDDDDDTNEDQDQDESPDSADNSQVISVLSNALQAGLGAVAAGSTPRAAVLSSIGHLIQGADNQSSNQTKK